MVWARVSADSLAVPLGLAEHSDEHGTRARGGLGSAGAGSDSWVATQRGVAHQNEDRRHSQGVRGPPDAVEVKSRARRAILVIFGLLMLALGFVVMSVDLPSEAFGTGAEDTPFFPVLGFGMIALGVVMLISATR